LYVFYGRPDFSAQLSTLDADFTLTGVSGQLTPLGDFNGDGYDDFGFRSDEAEGIDSRFDLMLGSPTRPSGFIASSALETSLASGPEGTQLERFGRSEAAGDVNG